MTALLSRRDLSIDVLTSAARWTDVAGTAAAVHPVEPREQDAAGLAAALGLEPAPPSWMAAWREAVDRLPALPEDGEALTPDSAALAVYAACSAPPAGAAPAEAVPDLVLGSSMTIRRLDRLAPPARGPAPAPIANRGLAGIDADAPAPRPAGSPRAISTGRPRRRRRSTSGLSTWSSPTALTGGLISGGASRLDAFSAYPARTWLPSGAPGGATGTPAVRPARSSRTSASAPQASYARNR